MLCVCVCTEKAELLQGYEDGHVVLASPLSEARIIHGDQIACGGIVVHTIDNILLPCTYQFGKGQLSEVNN